MKPIYPCPRGSALPKCGYPYPDYSLSSPISKDGIPHAPLCHHKIPYANPVAEFLAGETINMEFDPEGAPHGGGHCEFSLSYDGGSTFISILTILRTCFQDGFVVDVPIPHTAPASRQVVLAWTWVNAVGNREFYMTCSDIAIMGAPRGMLTGPLMLTPNYGDGPAIQEFSTGDDGSGYYKERKDIVVYIPPETDVAEKGMDEVKVNNSTDPGRVNNTRSVANDASVGLQ
ncbi:hypothetical protein IWQ60_000314 [Tieghemiomyces parasiticus]|uniref:Lytic polysaccharide monooxygenase n=1 Tax=Tieghemiomyces parasiticus TaxID=78921 RepID=A0A9W8E3K6_9FUNG|nr:hypothetical protein IWQ60_000314 [Tieghemiomyces parasiticus]